MKFRTEVEHQSASSNIKKYLYKINVIDHDLIILRPLSFVQKYT